MSIAGSHMNCCRDYKPSNRQSLGSARRGRDGNPASSTARVQTRKAPTYVPARDKLRSQPGREDHQAHRMSKGVKLTVNEGDSPESIAGGMRTVLLWLEVSANDKSPGRARRRTVSPTSHTPRKCPRNNPIRGWRARDTQESVKLTKWSPWIRAERRTVNRKHRPEHQRHPAKRRRPTRSGVRRYKWSHRNSHKGPYGTQPKGRRPSAKAKRAPKMVTVRKDTVQEGRQCARSVQGGRRK